MPSLRRNTFDGLYIIYVAIKYPITFDHAGAVWCISFSIYGEVITCAYRIHMLVLNINFLRQPFLTRNAKQEVQEKDL